MSKVCITCKESKPLSEYTKGRNECKSCKSEYNKAYRIKNKVEILAKEKTYRDNNKDKRNQSCRDYAQSIVGKLGRYKRNAVKRGIQFLLSDDEFADLVQQECHYCGSVDSMGVDRVDSLGDYTVDNCVPCCGVCNRMKMDMTETDFINQIEAIANHFRRP